MVLSAYGSVSTLADGEALSYELNDIFILFF